MTIAVRGDAETVQKGLPSGKGASFFLCLTTAFPAIRLSLCRGQPLEDFNLVNEGLHQDDVVPGPRPTGTQALKNGPSETPDSINPRSSRVSDSTGAQVISEGSVRSTRLNQTVIERALEGPLACQVLGSATQLFLEQIRPRRPQR